MPGLHHDIILLVIDHVEVDTTLLNLTLALNRQLSRYVRRRLFGSRVFLRIDKRFLTLLSNAESTIAPVLRDVILELPSTFGRWEFEQSLDVLEGLLSCMPELRELKIAMEPTGGIEMNETFDHSLQSFFSRQHSRKSPIHLKTLNLSQFYDAHAQEACERVLAVLSALRLGSCQQLRIDSRWDFTCLPSGNQLILNTGITKLHLRFLHVQNETDLDVDLLLGYVSPKLESLHLSIVDCDYISQVAQILKVLQDLTVEEEPRLKELTLEIRCHSKWLTDIHWSEASLWQEMKLVIGKFTRLQVITILSPVTAQSSYVQRDSQEAEQALQNVLSSYFGEIHVVENSKRDWLIVDRIPNECTGLHSKLMRTSDEYSVWEELN
uniref:Uncharacterized protein n=1 Tax=Moniliophthora roreri TaxID=221103 RepID=A0A0W0FQD3_MONRR